MYHSPGFSERNKASALTNTASDFPNALRVPLRDARNSSISMGWSPSKTASVVFSPCISDFTLYKLCSSP